jgi:hypothetical protein
MHIGADGTPNMEQLAGKGHSGTSIVSRVIECEAKHRIRESREAKRDDGGLYRESHLGMSI